MSAKNILDPSRMSEVEFFMLPAASGILNVVAAGTASAGHLYVARYTNANGKKFRVSRLRLLWQTLAGPNAEQEIAIAAYKLTGYSAAHTGGTAVAAQARSTEYETADGFTGLAGRISDITALTAGTHTIAAQPFMRGAWRELLVSNAIPRGFIDEERRASDDAHPVLVLANNEGILVRNEIAMGAGLTGRLMVELDGWER